MILPDVLLRSIPSSLLPEIRFPAPGTVPPIQGGKLDVANEEPLRRELVDFVDAVRHKREPGVTGKAGRDALELATRIAEKMAQ